MLGVDAALDDVNFLSALKAAASAYVAQLEVQRKLERLAVVLAKPQARL